MAVYVTSDLHGLELSKLERLLKLADFGENDWLYILGDVVDRQNDGGIEILKWLLEQPNIQLLLGNHEAMLLSCAFALTEITEENLSLYTEERMRLLKNYMHNGGETTLNTLRELLKTEPETVADILEYLKEAPLYESVCVNGRDFLLTHSGIDNFENNKPLEEYSAHDFLWNRPMQTDEYYDDVKTVFGHTPTAHYGSIYEGRILHTATWINIDVGAGYGYPPALLRLDDLKEFYLPEEA